MGTTPEEAINTGRISTVLQIGGLLGDIRAHEALTWIAAAYGGDVGSRENLERVTEQAGITEIAKRKIRKCFGGEQQRVRFAFALPSSPDLLILNEPAAGMDTQARRKFWQTMYAQAASGKTIISVTHYLQGVQGYAGHIVLMNHGKIVADGSPAEVTFRQQRVVFSVTSDAAMAHIRDHYPEVSLVAAVGRFQVSLAQIDGFICFAPAVPGIENLEVAQPSLEQVFFDLTEPDSSPNADARLTPYETETTATRAAQPSQPAYTTNQTPISKENQP